EVEVEFGQWQLAAVLALREVIRRRSRVREEVLEGRLRVAADVEPQIVGELVREVPQLELHEAAREVAGEVGRVALHDRDGVEELCGEQIQRDGASQGIRAG